MLSMAIDEWGYVEITQDGKIYSYEKVHPTVIQKIVLLNRRNAHGKIWNELKGYESKINHILLIKGESNG